MPRLTAAFLAVIAALATVPAAVADDYPSKPVRLIVPYSPGGGTDLIARPLAERLSAKLGQRFIVDNRGGANGNIGMELAARAAPDGYTLVLALTAQLAISPAFYPHLPYDAMRSYAPIGLLASAPYLLTTNPSLPVKSVADLIALATAKAGKVMFSTSGTGGIPHLAGELLNHMTGIKMIAVPYKGGGPAMLDVMAGQVQANFAAIPGAMVHVKSGRLRAVAVTSAKRFPAIPDVPAIAETLPGYEIATWFCVLGPAGTPPAVIQKLNRQIVEIISEPQTRDYLLANGFQPLTGTPENLAAYIESEMTKWAKIVEQSGVKPD